MYFMGEKGGPGDDWACVFRDFECFQLFHYPHRWETSCVVFRSLSKVLRRFSPLSSWHPFTQLSASHLVFAQPCISWPADCRSAVIIPPYLTKGISEANAEHPISSFAKCIKPVRDTVVGWMLSSNLSRSPAIEWL